MLAKLYEISYGYNFLHEWARLVVLHVEVPLIRFFLKLACSSKIKDIIVRHSLVETGGFNLFVSDIDLTLVISNGVYSTSIIQSFNALKKVFINLGEPEVVTQDEQLHLSTIEKTEYSSFWAKLFQLRKIAWQLQKNEDAADLEKMKIVRGLGKCKTKLNSDSLVISIRKAFPQSIDLKATGVHFPHFSAYLGCWVEVGSSMRNHALIAASEEEANGFLSLLPDYEYLQNTEQIELREFILQKERLLSLSQFRLLESQNKPAEHLSEWIKKLQSKN